MNLGLADYGSDSDSDSGSPPPQAKSSLAASLPPPTAKPTKTKRGPKKITIGLPALSSAPPDDDDDERPVAKKPRLDSGAGRSSLLGMLPAPKQKAPVLPAPERVLGGGKGPGLVFNAARPPQPTRDMGDAEEDEDEGDTQEKPLAPVEAAPEKETAMAFLPPSLKKGRAGISVEETSMPKAKAKAPATRISAAPAGDFFSLGGSSSSAGASSSTSPSISAPIPASVSSAPKVEEFRPPSPTPTDPYPGYYLLPSGSWAAHDPDYYAKYYKKWQAEYNAQLRALEKGKTKGFEGYDEGTEQEVNMSEEMERARREVKEREEQKQLTMGAAKEGEIAAPRMNVKGAKLGKGARTRHQLSTLLTEAYENREALEEKIAQGRRNRKEAGNKYGF
ncbi:hypothetical protein PLICRDRAFT_41607 [Plicaturopsis crispa FD-325 SS-3]|nr:hypothetical protein PLICRDRAFT_41607 [Plicaturopsis crispa FD-325 SS-3]